MQTHPRPTPRYPPCGKMGLSLPIANTVALWNLKCSQPDSPIKAVGVQDLLRSYVWYLPVSVTAAVPCCFARPCHWNVPCWAFSLSI